MPKGAQKRRNELIASEVLKVTGTHLLFTTDYAFASSSMAAAVVSGQSVAGPKAWCTHGKSFSDWEADFASGMDEQTN